MVNFFIISILSAALAVPLGCSKKNELGAVDTSEVASEPESTTTEIDGGGVGKIPGEGLPAGSQVLPPPVFEAQVQSNLTTVKVGSTLSCMGTTTAAEGEVISYTASWFQSSSLMDGWDSYQGALDSTGQLALVGAESAHKFFKCRLQAQSSSGLSTTANSQAVAVIDSPIVIMPISLIAFEDHPLPVTLSLGNGYSDDDLDAAISIQNTSVVGGSFDSWVCIEGACTSTFNPSPNFNGDASFDFNIVSSFESAAFSGHGQITVTPVNDAPLISDITNKVINEDSSLTAISFTIADVDSGLSCQSSVSAVSSNTSLLNSSQISFSGTVPNCQLTAVPDANTNGLTTIIVSVTDDASLVANDSFQLTVDAVNDPPSTPSVVEVSGNSGVAVGKTVDCTGQSIDVDGDSLFYTRSFEVGSSPTGPWSAASGTLNASSQLVIRIADAHKYLRCTVVAADGQGGTSSMTSPETEISDAEPVASNLAATIQEDNSKLISISSGALLGYVDSDGDLADSVEVDGLSSGVFDGPFVCDGGGVCTATYIPQLNFNGVASFNFTVVNNYGSSASAQYVLNITPVNDSPIFVSSANTPIEKGLPFSLALSTSDVDSGDFLTASCISNCPSGLNFSGTNLNWLPLESHLGHWMIGVRITDQGGLSDQGTVEITVLDRTPPDVPTINSVMAIDPISSRAFSITGTADNNTTVSIFKNATCTNSPEVQISSNSYNSMGSQVTLAASEIYVVFSAMSVDSSGNASVCSSPFQLMRGASKVRGFAGAEGSSAPDRAAEYLGKYYFAADDLSRGRELWVYDPASGSSTLVADIEPSGSSSPTNLVSIGSYLYFSATTYAKGRELWRTDGTSSGTIQLADFCTGSCSSTPSAPIALNGKAYFAAATTTWGNELLVSDGTTAGTILVKDIRPGTSSSTPLYLTLINNSIWMQAADATTGTEVWISDGTSSGTILLKDIYSAGNSAPQGFTPITGGVVFQATTASAGAELWFSDGTSIGTQLVSDIQTGTTGSSPSGFISYGGKAYFAATTTTYGKELWTTDGTPAGTYQVLDINAGTAASNPTSLTLGLGKFFFQATTAAAGAEVWVSDGTAIGTTLLKDIRSGTSSSTPTNFSASANRVYFSADTNANRELWVTDGTTSGTIQYDIYSGGSGFSGSTYWITATAFGALFQGTNATNGAELYKFTESGSSAQMVSNIAGPGSLLPKNMITMNGVAYFLADDGVSGTELWSYDGTTASLVKDICTGSCSSLITSLYTDGSKLYFSAYTATLGSEPWVSDGTNAGTVNLANLGNTTASSSPSGFVKMGGDVFFVAASTTYGRELYKTDGTTVGTTLVKDIKAGTSASNPSNPVVVGGNTLYFQANDGTTGAELWKSNGTTGGTVLVADFIAGTTGLTPINLTALASNVVFSGTTSSYGAELYASDGSTISLLSDIKSGTSGSSPTNFVVYAGKAYFSAAGANGTELYSTDGTIVGTTFVKDIYSGTTGSSPANMVATSTGIYFTANTATQGIELWKSDGTTSGTTLVSDIFVGTSSSSPSSLVALGDKVYFTANNGTNGYDIFQVNQSTVIRVFDNVFQSVSIPSFAAPNDSICFFGSTGTGPGSASLLCW